MECCRDYKVFYTSAGKKRAGSMTDLMARSKKPMTMFALPINQNKDESFKHYICYS